MFLASCGIGMNMQLWAVRWILRIHHLSPTEEDDRDLEDQTVDKVEPKTQPEKEKAKRTMEDDDKIAFNRLISALNDLAKGQKEVLSAINRLVDKPGKNQNNRSSYGIVGSTSGNGSHVDTTMQSHSHLPSTSSRPMMQPFLDSPTTGQIVQEEQMSHLGHIYRCTGP